ncbi:MAG: PAS domain-containing protein, partial [Acidobacteriaceae bacterium]
MPPLSTIPRIDPTAHADQLFARGGETGALMRSLDWSQTPLGPIENWPQSLKTSVSICLHSRFPVLVWWGPELVKIYNDAYVQLIGGKHPWALGRPGRQVWPEIWDTIGPMLHGVLERAQATYSDDLLLLLERNGYPEECYFTFSYSPIHDESGGVGGVFTPVAETTQKVIGERRLRTLRDLAATLGAQSRNIAEACSAAAHALSSNSYDLPFAAIYLFDGTTGSQPLRTAGSQTPASHLARLTASTGDGPPAFPPEIDFPGAEWLPYAKLLVGETCLVDLGGTDIPVCAPSLPRGAWNVPLQQAILSPILRSATHAPIGFLFAGVSPRKRLNDSYRSFYTQICDQISSGIKEAQSFERESLLLANAEAERNRIRDLFLNAPAPIAMLSGPEHRFTFINDLYVHLLGRKSAADVLGKTMREALPELEGQVFFDLLDQVYRTAAPHHGYEVEVRLDRAAAGKSSQAYFNFIYQPVRDANGQVEGILVIALEVTDQVLARNRIRDSEALLEH